jgi:hypothetical protein
MIMSLDLMSIASLLKRVAAFYKNGGLAHCGIYADSSM